ncbi:hypothetical protein N9063_01105 [Deltaproteobacteria bacterium]|nr:hypothetical protein [Deltaproteobacteria bacterium]
MIWLSPMTGTEEGSVYFDVRDITLQQTDNGTDGLIRGLLGDGQREIWGEVQLGKNPQVRILPLWTDDGQIESLSAAIDEELLKEQLLDAVQKLFAAVGGWSTSSHMDRENHLSLHNQGNCHWLAA